MWDEVIFLGFTVSELSFSLTVALRINYRSYSVPPSVYKRVKQAPENKRESHLIKELEEILSKEGLSANPSDKG